ncbi:MAG TPA: ATP-binding protein [Planctomycetota bacterium]|nr:ATP-binding protein [Planctomycetota bacterium]
MADTLRILVVDDELGMRLGIARALRDFAISLPDVNGEVRFAVEQADSAETALDMIAEARPDILLLDYKLPNMSGLEVLDRVGAGGTADGTTGEMLTIMVTAYASLETAVSAVKRGAYDFLAKPFTPDELRSTVRKAAGRLVLAKQARKFAQEKRQVRFEFISVLAHELKAPLGAVEGYLNIVKDRSAGDDHAVYERIIDRSLIRISGMRKMIADLLDLTRIESGQKQRELTSVDIIDAAHAVLSNNTAEAAMQNITLALEATAPISFNADRSEIEIILNNLVSNAIKYNRDGGRVYVRIRNDGQKGDLVISVDDTGIGMSPQETARLFSDFVRIRNEKTKNILGSGLGLSIVRKLATLYGGDISVSSQPDAGSTFTVVLKQS